MTKFDPADPENVKDSTNIPVITGNAPSIATGPDGNLWVAAPDNIVRIPPGDPGDFTPFAVGELSPGDIDAAGSLLAVADFTGRVVTSTTDGDIDLYPLSGGSQGVAGAPSGQIAFSQQASAPHEVGLLTPPGLPLLAEVPEADPFGVALGPDGAYWSALFATDTLARLTTTGELTTLATASGPASTPSGSAPC